MTAVFWHFKFQIENMDFAFLDTLISPLLEVAGGEWLKNREARKKFENDLKLFLTKQLEFTPLDIFKFADRPDIKQDDEFFRLEHVYIPLRLHQTHELTADREHFMLHFQPSGRSIEKGKKELLKDVGIAQLLQMMHKADENRRVLLIGNGGSGKSTFSKYLARFFADDGERKVRALKKTKDGKAEIKTDAAPFQYFPVFLRLRDLENELRKYNQPDWEDNFTLEKFFGTRYGLDFETPNFYGKLFKHFPCLFLLDGVDEVPELKQHERFTVSRIKVVQWLIKQVKLLSQFHPKSAFILTSRPTDHSLLARHFQVFEVQPFDDAEILLFSQHWYNTYEKTLHFLIRHEPHSNRCDFYRKLLEHLPENRKSFEKNLDNKHLRELISNPLLLSQAILIHSIDEGFEIENTEDLYEKFVQTLLYRWDEVRKMDFYPALLGNRNVGKMYQLLRRIAFFFSEKETASLEVKAFLPDMVRAIERFKHLLPEPEKVSELSLELLTVFRDRSGILTGSMVSDEDFLDTKFEFQHKSLQDYLTAKTIAEDALLQNGQFSLHDKLGKPFWTRTIEFYVNTGNPDFFFEDFIGRLAPGSPEVKKLRHFTQHFLDAREKRGDLGKKLAAQCWEIFCKTSSTENLLISMACLSKLNDWPETEALVMMKTHPANLEEAERLGKLGQLLFLKGRYEQIRDIVLGTIEQFAKKDSPELFRMMSNFSPLVWRARDWTATTRLLEQANKSTSRYQLMSFYHLRDLLDLQGLRGLLDLRGLRDLRDLPDWWELWLLRAMLDLQYLEYLRTLQEVQHLKHLGELTSSREQQKSQYLRELRELDAQTLEEFEKKLQEITPLLKETISKSLRILQGLSEADKRKYFKYVD